MGITAVRVPLNEACWNGESYVPAASAGANYVSAVKSYVSLLNDNGIVAILDLHWTDGAYNGTASACASAQATCQKPMPDSAQAIPFWISVASTFKGNNAVIFDLFNEPYPDIAAGAEVQGWQTGRARGGHRTSVSAAAGRPRVSRRRVTAGEPSYFVPRRSDNSKRRDGGRRDPTAPAVPHLRQAAGIAVRSRRIPSRTGTP
jgi:hypothetical protein